MAQFDIRRNQDGSGKARTPFLMEIQADVLSALETRMVIPLRVPAMMKGKPISRLHPAIQVEGAEYIAIVSEMAAVPRSRLGPVAGSAPGSRQAIIEALDLIFTGF